MRGNFSLNFLLLFALFSVISRNEALKILGLFPHPGMSHFQFFHPIMRGLAESGHSVDVLSHFPDRQPLPGYTDYTLPGENLNNALSFDIFEGINYPFLMPFAQFFYLYEYGKDDCNNTLNAEALERILKHPAGYYDVILLEQFNTDCMMGVAHQLQAPVVALSSCALMPWHYERMGAPIIPSHIPALLLAQSQDMSFSERLTNWITTHTLNWFYSWFSVPATDELLRLRFGPEVPSTGELVKNTSIILLNQHFSLSGPKPIPPNVIEVGGLHLRPAQPLNDELQQLLDNAHHGVILISWGSQLSANTISSVKREGLLRAVARLKQQVIWKWENDTLPNKPANLHIMKWLPQRDILSHPNVRAFFTHGGLMGLTEAVSNGVPIVGMPMFGDQSLNIAALVQRGMAIQLDFHTLDEDSIFEALSKALQPEYKQNAVRVAAGYKERPLKPLESAIWWVEHVAATHGAPLLKPSAVHLNRFVYYSLDVYLLVAISLLLILASGFGIVRLCRGNKKPKKAPAKKSKRN